MDTFAGGAGNDVFNATGSTLTALDNLSGGAGTDVLNIVDAAGVLNAAFPAAVTASGVETLNITSVGTVGRNATAAVTNAVAGQLTYTFSGTGTLAAGDSINVTINGLVKPVTAASASTINSVSAVSTAISTLKTDSTAALATAVSNYNTSVGVASLASNSTKVGQAATAFAAYTTGGAAANGSAGALDTLNAALTTIKGSAVSLTATQADAAKVASVGAAATVSSVKATDDAVQAVTTYTEAAALTGLTGTLATDQAAVASAVQTALRASLATSFAAAIGAGDATVGTATASGNAVVVTGPNSGAALPTISFATNANAALTPATSGSVSPVPVSAAVAAAAYDVSGLTDTTAVNVNSIGGTNIAAASTQAVTITNTGGGTVTLAGGASQTVTHSGAATLSGSTGAVTLVDAVQGAGAIAVTGGTNVSVTASGNAGGTISVGTAPTSSAAPSGPSGTVSVSSAATSGTMGAITVSGGTSITVTETASRSAPTATSTGSPNPATTAQGAVTVYGTAVTTNVTVTQTAARTGVPYQQAIASAREVDSVTFTALAAGASVTVGGLKFTAGDLGATAAQVASAFAGLANGASAGAAQTAVGTFSGALSGYTSGSANGSAVLFTKTTAAATSAISVSASSPSFTPTVAVVTNGAVGQVGSGTGAITNGAVTITDINYSPTGSTANGGTGTKLGTIGTVTVNNFAPAASGNTTDGLIINNSGLSTLNVTGGRGNIVINDGASQLASATALTSLTVNMGGQAGGTLSSATSNYATLNLNLTAASALTNISMAGVTALNLGGSAALSLAGAAGLTAVKTITVTGAAGLNANTVSNTNYGAGGALLPVAGTLSLASNSTLLSVDASASSGALNIAVNSAVTSVAGGSGNDSITASSTVSKSITTGAGNDTVTFAPGTLAITAGIDGGAGTDTLVMTTAQASTVSGASSGLTSAVFKSYVTGFETLGLYGGGSDIATNAQAIKLADLGFASSVLVADKVAANGTLTLDQFANGGSLTISASQTNASSTIALTNAVAWANATTNPSSAASYVGNSVNVTLAGKTVDTYSSIGQLGAPSLGSINGGTLSLSNVGTVNIVAADTGSSVVPLAVANHSLSLSDTMAAVVNVSGNANFTLTTTGSTGLTTINASAMTGNFAYNALTSTAAASANGTGVVTVTGGAGNDTLIAHGFTNVSGTVTLAATSNIADVLNGGLGNDTLYANAGANILTGGGGVDTFVVQQVSAAKTIYTTITDFIVGDKLVLKDMGVVEKFVSTKVDLSTLAATATLSDAINAATIGADTGVIKWFQFGGDTYLIESGTGHTGTTAFQDSVDLVVKMSGLIDLSKAAFNDGSLSAGVPSLTLFG